MLRHCAANTPKTEASRQNFQSTRATPASALALAADETAPSSRAKVSTLPSAENDSLKRSVNGNSRAPRCSTRRPRQRRLFAHACPAHALGRAPLVAPSSSDVRSVSKLRPDASKPSRAVKRRQRARKAPRARARDGTSASLGTPCSRETLFSVSSSRARSLGRARAKIQASRRRLSAFERAPPRVVAGLKQRAAIIGKAVVVVGALARQPNQHARRVVHPAKNSQNQRAYRNFRS